MSSRTNEQANDSCIKNKSFGIKGQKSKTKWWIIDKETIRYKIHYILWFGGLGTVTPCISVFAKNRLHLSPSSFAAITVFQQFMLVIIKPILGYIVDYLNKLKEIIWILTVLKLIALCLLLIAPEIPKGTAIVKNYTVLENPDLCELRKTGSEYPHIRSSPNVEISLTRKTHASVSENTVLHISENNCSKILTNFINGDLPKMVYFSHTHLPKRIENTSLDASQVLPEPECYNSLLCPDSNPYNIMVENCIFCCKTYNECRLMTNISTKMTESTFGGSDFEHYEFWIFAILYIVIYSCSNSIFALTDAACCETVAKLGKDFGKERLWGAFGWGLFAPIGGFLDDYTEDYLAASGLCGVMILLMLLNLSKMDLVKPHFSKNILKDVGTVVRARSFIYFMVDSLVSGIGFGIVWYYLIWFVVSIGGDRLICGLVHAIQCFAGEIPFMFFSGWIINKVGYLNVSTLTHLAACIRFFWYSQLQNPWYVLLIEWTHGITYGLFYTSMASFAKASAKPGTEATTQSIIFLIFEGMGSGIGSVMAGLGFSYVGGHQTFLCCGVIFGFCTVMNIGYTLFDTKSKNLKCTKKIMIQTKL